ncbi:MAG: AMP-binding protein, partial [Nocardioides sp.]
LVLVEGANTVEAITGYLAAIQHGHVALLVPHDRPAQLDQLVSTYDPDVVFRHDGRAWSADPRRDGSAHELHPDLRLLLSTSGSTGSPKLVRLSGTNLRSNAEGIASYLRLTPEDRAATSLPLHYCYGLSVVNSHLATGAGLVLTDHSVVDECFWHRFQRDGATSFAGVPYTFDLLEHSGFAERDLPELRYVTQAGGRLDPARVVAWAELGERRGWDFVVMYGQTEATARMAWLPPGLATRRPAAIGVAVPGGSLRLEPVPECPEPGTGELVYSGPNVMMGYAESPADLATGDVVGELRTGDLARVEDGLFEVIGRRSRNAKVFGLRIDLDRVERATPDPVCAVAVDDTLHVFTTVPRATSRVHDAVTALCGLPARAVRVHLLTELPRLATGKPDLAGLERQARLLTEDLAPGAGTTESGVEALRADFAVVLGRPDAGPDHSFVALGGDSLSYVELATRLGRRLGDLPHGWHTRTIRQLADHDASGAPGDPTEATGPVRQARGVRTDTTVVLRALAILAIVGTHANVFTVVGGAHLLLAVAGFNFARFQLASVPRRVRIRNGVVAVAQVAVPSALFIGAVAATTRGYDAATAVFLNGLLGSDTWTDDWQFWFLEALIWTSLGALALTALPRLDRVERREPFRFALGVLAVTVAVRFAWVGLEAGPNQRYLTALVLWCFALGWVAARARTHGQRLLVLLAGAASTIGYFGDLSRELVVLGGVAALLWLPVVRVPARLGPVVTVLASSSLFVYLTHWQVYPHLEVDHPLLATAASFAVGIGYWWLVRPLVRRLGSVLRRL